MRQRTRIRRITDELKGIGEGVGGRVKHWQWEQGLSDEELAGKAGISVELLQRIKDRVQKLTPSTLRRLARALKVTVAELVE